MLSSALHSALSGISTAGLAVQVAANNVANAQTDGFKSSRPVRASQSPQTISTGSSSNATSGGTNPVQTGRGVQVAAIDADFSQGSLVASSNALDLAIEGDGLFILEGHDGQPTYSRNGRFRLNAAGQLVSASGHRVLGYSVDSGQQIDASQLTSLRIPSQYTGSAGSLTGFSIEQDGRLKGRFSDGTTRVMGQIALARFSNPSGLVRRGGNLYASGSNSGLPMSANLGTSRIVSGARELSNTNVAANLIDLSLASNMYRANLAVIDAGDELLEEILHLRRS